MANPPNSNASRGYLIQNEKKHDRQPDLRGKVTIEGKEWNLAVWAKGQKDGKDFFSIEASDPALAPNRAQAGQSPGQSGPSGSQGQGSNQSYRPSQPSAPSHDGGGKVDEGFGSVFDGLP